jgi:hypothetical protein
MAPPTARFQIAFTGDTLDPDPAWTDLDDIIRMAEYTIDRGRSFELDRVDTGRATVYLNDTQGILDPTNLSSPFHNKIQPLKQARLALWNPVLEDWYTRFRGFVDSFTYDFDPSQRVNRVTVELVDIFEIVSACEMFPGHFGELAADIPKESKGQVYFAPTPDDDQHGMQLRCNQVLDQADIPSEFREVFSGNVALRKTVYSPGESAMTAIQEAVDAEFPAVGNVYGNRLGKLAIHGRFARFDPEGTATATGWDFNDWKAGDGAAVTASPTDTAHLRGFSMSRDLSKVINRAMAAPFTNDANPNFAGQVVQDDTSKDSYGIRPWSTENLLTKQGVTTGLDAWQETKTFAAYYVTNYKTPHNRISAISFRPMRVGAPGAAACWDFMCRVDINDRVTVTIGSPGGGGLAAHQFFVEGVHEQVQPLNGGMDDVTLTLDLSPADYFADNPYA